MLSVTQSERNAMTRKRTKMCGLFRHPVRALACDGDGTLTTRKILARKTTRALDAWRSSGRRIILTTGETTTELKKFPEIERFDLVVAERCPALLARQQANAATSGPTSGGIPEGGSPSTNSGPHCRRNDHFDEVPA
jgi:hypothetical protein